LLVPPENFRRFAALFPAAICILPFLPDALPTIFAVMIALLDYGSGNLRSVHKALLKAGATVRLVQHPEEIGDASGLVLPGVGAFDDCINALRKQELLEAARTFTQSGRPFLGICVGYQALFERSEEFNSCAAGLGLFGGRVVRFPAAAGLKIPQIGRTAPSTKACRKAVTFILFTVFTPSRWMPPLWPRERITASTLPPPCGRTTCLPRSFTRKKASGWDCKS